MSGSVSARGRDASQRAAACRASRRRAAAAAAEERGERERFRARVESGFFPSESLLLLRLSRSIFPMFSSPFCFSLVPNETHRRHHGAGISDLCRPEFRGVTRARERESEHEGGSDEIEKKNVVGEIGKASWRRTVEREATSDIAAAPTGHLPGVSSLSLLRYGADLSESDDATVEGIAFEPEGQQRRWKGAKQKGTAFGRSALTSNVRRGEREFVSLFLPFYLLLP